MTAFDTDEAFMVSVTVPTDRIFRRQAAMILFTMSLGVFIAQLDSQVVNLAIKDIGGDLNAGINALQWVIDSYNLFYATLLLTGGTLGDLYARVCDRHRIDRARLDRVRGSAKRRDPDCRACHHGHRGSARGADVACDPDR